MLLDNSSWSCTLSYSFCCLLLLSGMMSGPPKLEL